MSDELILKEIFNQNKHWRGDISFFEGKDYKRKLFYEILKYLPEKQILSIVGLHRTGKTILLKQTIKKLVETDHVDPRSILFLSLDEALITSKLTLKDYLDNYLDTVSPDTQSKRYIVIDEIQYIDKWQHILKRYYDSQNDIKFIISGSSSLYLKKRTTESLVGRIYDFTLNPLSFEEYLELSSADNNLLSGFIIYALEAGNSDFAAPEKEYTFFLAQYGNILRLLFEQYLLYFQFPEMVFQKDKEIIRKYLINSIYKKTVEYDIPRLFSIDKIGELKFIFQMLINETGNILEFKNISSEAGVEESTLKKYIYYFQESFLLDLVYNYSPSIRKPRRLQKKSYIASTNFYTAFHPELFEDVQIVNQNMGRMVENHIFKMLKDKFNYIAFFRKGNREIDFLAGNDFSNKKKFRLIEVKYVNNLRWEDISFIDKINRDIFKTDKYFIYSKNIFSLDDKKVVIPSFLIK